MNMYSGDSNLDIAATTDEYELEDLELNDETMASKEEFKLLYNKNKAIFEIDCL